jgi:hypothetical protein
MQQQQRLAATVGGREILGDLPVEGADVKRMKCSSGSTAS